MKTIEKVKALIEKDGGEIIRVDLFGDVLVVVATHSSIHQVTRFKTTGEKMGMFEDSEIEIKEKGVVFSTALAV